MSQRLIMDFFYIDTLKSREIRVPQVNVSSPLKTNRSDGFTNKNLDDDDQLSSQAEYSVLSYPIY